MNYVSFPGLGIDEFKINSVAIPNFLGLGIDIAWYGIIITLGIISAVMYVLYRAKNNEGIKTDDVLDYAIFLVLFGVIGARLYYVIMEFDQMKGETLAETLYNTVAVWNGGLAIYGGIIAGAVALIAVSLYKKIKLGKAFDMIAPAVMLGQIIGRWGNFFNGEAYGWSENVDKLPWRMYLKDAYRTETVNGIKTDIPVDFVHPTFLYESLWNLLGFIIINTLYKKKKFDGQIFLMYISWYGFGRMFIEGLRTDSLYVGDYRISQVVAFLCFFFGFSFLTAMLIVIKLREKDAKFATASAGTETEEPVSDKKSATDTLSEKSAEDIKNEDMRNKDGDAPSDTFEISDRYADDE